jgi:Ala-tRNA(Pro) deacylase
MAIPLSITRFLDDHHARYSVLTHPAAYTAQQEAAAAHVPGREWAKAVVCMADGRPVLAVLPAPFRVDFERLKGATQTHEIRLANEQELKDLYSDCDIGAMPPLGPLYGQPVVVDKALAEDREIVFDAGSHHDSIRMSYAEFERLVRPMVAGFGIGPRGIRTALAHTFVTDVVCGDRLSDETTWWSEHHGERYFFCSQACKMEFDDNPISYVRGTR